jgi:FkbM family methyltransferase
MIKGFVRGLLGQYGYVVRSIGDPSGVTGVDLLHDVQVVLGEKRPVTLFDVGANIGQTVDTFLRTFPECRIYSFEPSPLIFETLKAKFGRDARCHLENLALGDQVGTLPFQVTKDHSVNDSLLEPAWDAKAKTVMVPVSTLDENCQQHRIETIDYLKIDTQGYDLNVLRGSSRMLTEKRIHAFSAELIFTSMYKNQPSFIGALSLPLRFGYRLLGFYEQTYRDNQLIYANALFVQDGRDHPEA